MKVMFERDDKERAFYGDILRSFCAAEFRDELHLATLNVSENTATYTTCRGNKWYLEHWDGYTYFGYEGTRDGALWLRPFEGLRWFLLDEKEPVLAVVEETAEVREIFEGDKVFLRRVHTVPVRTKLYKLKLKYYETTTPPEWGLWWCDRVLRVGENAVIMRGREPRIENAVVPYKNVYKSS
jgi:hypothetical protein